MKNFAKKLLSGLCVLATLSCYGCGLLWGDSDSSSGGETVIENGFVDEIFNGNYTQISGEELAELAKTVEEGSPKRIFSVNEGVIVRRMGEGTGDAHIGDGTPLSSSTSRTVIQKGEGVNGSYRAQCNSTENNEGSLYGEYSSYDDGTTLYTKQWRDRSDTKKEKTDSKGLESYYSIFTLLGGVIGEGSEGSEGGEVTESSSFSTVTTASGGTEESVEQEMIRDLFSLEQYAEALEISESDEEGELTKYMLYQDKTDSNYIKIKVELAVKIKPEFEGDGEKILIEREVYFIYDVGSRELVAYSYNHYQEVWYYDGDGRSYEWGFSIAPWSGTITPPEDLDTYGAGEDNSTEGGTPTPPLIEMEGLSYEVVGDYAVCRGIGTATNTDIVIASTYQGKPVVMIGDGAFSDCTSLTSVSIPDSVITIGKGAFAGCTNLASVSIPDRVTTVGGYAFYGCTNLTIYAEAAEQPSGWDSEWNTDNCPVEWGYTGA